MKKHIILIGTILLSTYSFSQVGINTDQPKATLDVEGSPSNYSIIDGLIAPRLEGNELKAKDGLYEVNQIGTIIYALSASSDAGIADTKTINVDAPGYYYFDGSIWQKFTGGVSGGTEPWRIQNTTDEAIANTDNIYQQGKVAVGFTDADAVSEKQLEVKGDFKTETEVAGRTVGFETNYVGSGIGIWYNLDDMTAPTDVGMIQLHQNSVHLVAQSPTNVGASQITAGMVEYRAGNWGLTDGVSLYHMDKDQILLSSGSGSGTGSEDLTNLYVRKGEGILFSHTDENTELEGQYRFPRNAGTVGQVLAVETHVVSSNFSELSWQDPVDLIKAAMPKFFYMPSVEIPTHDTATGTVLTGTQTINLYNSYTQQFQFTGGIGQVRSNASSTIPTLPANELDYFITYYDTDVFENVVISTSGELTYQIKATAVVTPKTFMNIVFKVKD